MDATFGPNFISAFRSGQLSFVIPTLPSKFSAFNVWERTPIITLPYQVPLNCPYLSSQPTVRSHQRSKRQAPKSFEDPFDNFYLSRDARNRPSDWKFSRTSLELRNNIFFEPSRWGQMYWRTECSRDDSSLRIILYSLVIELLPTRLLALSCAYLLIWWEYGLQPYDCFYDQPWRWIWSLHWGWTRTQTYAAMIRLITLVSVISFWMLPSIVEILSQDGIAQDAV